MSSVTVIEARYGGTYEGGRWVAFPVPPDRVPDAAFGDDNTCQEFYIKPPFPVGAGDSPEAARADLEAKRAAFDDESDLEALRRVLALTPERRAILEKMLTNEVPAPRTFGFGEWRDFQQEEWTARWA
ncbi:hypothetical protein [Streptomyces sp. AP-93]|uniref:hypothetical protein n=1 Tax=Streptomyces sp. AP-93 TaxID=2929048 RepID=UPI001FB044D4|nr:hypothetical protein [Streptomyces sp. AP-93]MCJ0868111.1 hypothetical protein [Streptomyces sp. AP-93]